MSHKRLFLTLILTVLLSELSTVPLLATASVSSQSGEGNGPGQVGSIDTTPQVAEGKTYRYFFPVMGRSSPPRNLRQIRALWSWAGYAARSKHDIDDLVAKVDGARLNAILLLVYTGGTAFFEPSHVRFPDARDRLPNRSPFSEWGYSDALSYLLAIRDRRLADSDLSNDFEVHAWFAVAAGGDWRDGEGWPRPENTEPYMLHYLHPEFKIKHGCYYSVGDGRCVSHRFSVVHQPRFRAYMADLIAGLVEDYDVDGVHLDYIRAVGICYNDEFLDYPGTEYDFPGCQEDYKAWTRETYGSKYSLWQDTDGNGNIRDRGSGRIAAWQERAMGLLVEEIHDKVKSVRPDVIISAAVGATSPAAREESVQGQAAWEWLDSGWIDAAFVMAYSDDTQAVIDQTQEFMNATRTEDGRSRVFPGLATYDVNGTGGLWADLVVEQVDAIVHGQWAGRLLEPLANGVALFVAERLSGEAVQALGDGPFETPVRPYWSRNLLHLNAAPSDGAVHLAWAAFEDSAWASYAISYTYGSGGQDASQGQSSIQGIPLPAQAYTLTGVTNYVPYTITVVARDGNQNDLILSNEVVVIPTDIHGYVPALSGRTP